MNTLAAKWNNYWFKSLPYEYLSITRILAVTTQLILFYIFDPGRPVYTELIKTHEIYWPLPVLRILTLPLGWGWMPTLPVLDVIYWGVLVFGILSLMGYKTNFSLGIFTVGSVFLQAFLYSFNDMHHGEAIMMFALMALTLSPSGKTLSMDAYLSGHKYQGQQSPYARWPLLLIQWIIVLLYFSAAYIKLDNSGLQWMNGHSLQYYLVQDGLKNNIPLGLWLARQHNLVSILSVFTILFEAGFVFCMFYRKLLWVALPMGLGFHLGIWFAMRAPFFELMVLYIAFLPWIPRIRLQNTIRN